MLNIIYYILLLIQLSLASILNNGLIDYSDYQIIRIWPKDANDCQLLRSYENDHEKNVEYWNEPTSDLRPVLCLIGPDSNQFLQILNKSHITYQITSNNFQKVIDSERKENSRYVTDLKQFNYQTKYYTYSEIKDLLHRLSQQNEKAKYKSVGKSYENRDIPAIIVTNPSEATKQTIFFECGIHAREWISTASCLYMINQLLTNNNNNKYLDKYEFIIVPTLNVDGYVFTWEKDRRWRKTRSLDKKTGCHGTDANRNWGTAWCEEGANRNPCSQQYCGLSSFSEVEVKQWSELVATRKGNIAAYFAFHSYSQYWMYPYGHTRALPPDADQLEKLSTAAVNAIHAKHGSNFTKGNIADVIYIASGSSIDWVYNELGAQVVFALELRPDSRSSNGFVLPPAQIKPASEEAWAGVQAVIDLL